VHPAGQSWTRPGRFFAALDARVDYAVVLSADHGGIDLPERLREQGLPEAQRAAEAPGGATSARRLPNWDHSARARLLAESAGSLVCSEGPFWRWINPNLSPERRAKVVAS
jgi:hypothetical protein